ncbi:MAG: hypothetical protein ACK5N8_02100 [Alphaproteobacteria bacterium]
MLTLKKEISRTTEDIDGDDVLNTKNELSNMGYYKADEKVGMNKFTDEGLFKGISSFQKDNKLKVDEVMKPDGETERKINELTAKSSFRNDFENKKDNSHKNHLEKTYKAQKEDEMIKNLIPVIHSKTHEDVKLFPYLDTRNNITVGGGKNVQSRKEFDKIKWVNKEGVGHSQEAAFKEKEKLEKLIVKDKMNNLRADHFEKTTNLRMKKEDLEKTTYEHIKATVPIIKKKFPEFDTYPKSTQEVLIDMEYNMGGRFNKSWKKFFKAIEARDFEQAAKESERGALSAERNKWTREKLLNH